MKYAIVFFSLLLAHTMMQAQNTWCVSIRGNTRLKHVEENIEKNVIRLQASELNTPGFFRINFNRSDTAMHRTMLLRNAAGTELARWEEVKQSWRMRTEELKKLMDKNPELSFYYTEIPRDVNMAMVIRVRPIHLCTLKRTVN